MKFTIAIALLALAAAVFAADPVKPAETGISCADKDTTGAKLYKDPSSKSGISGAWGCMKYHNCKDGKDTVHSCFWLIPLRQYDPTTRTCTWFWKANCDATDPK